MPEAVQLQVRAWLRITSTAGAAVHAARPGCYEPTDTRFAAARAAAAADTEVTATRLASDLARPRAEGSVQPRKRRRTLALTPLLTPPRRRGRLAVRPTPVLRLGMPVTCLPARRRKVSPSCVRALPSHGPTGPMSRSCVRNSATPTGISRRICSGDDLARGVPSIHCMFSIMRVSEEELAHTHNREDSL